MVGHFSMLFDSLFGLGSCVGVGDTLFELETGLFKRLDGDEIEDSDPETPVKVPMCQQIIRHRYQQQ
jgi:hypothetical protein